MEFINTIINFMKVAVMGFGAVVAIMGLMDFGEGKSNQNTAKKDEGIQKVVGGIVIILIGSVLVPQISSFFTI